MKSILTSIQPKWCELILNGSKTIDVRKTKPKLETPFKVLIYCTKEKQQYLQSRSNMYFYLESEDFIGGHGAGLYTRLNGKVIGEFVCDYILQFAQDDYYSPYDISDDDLIKTSLTQEDLYKYGKGKTLYGWHISDLKIYDKPKELSEFKKINRKCWYADLGLAKRDCPECKNEKCYINHPPQSWCYIEEA